MNNIILAALEVHHSNKKYLQLQSMLPLLSIVTLLIIYSRLLVEGISLLSCSMTVDKVVTLLEFFFIFSQAAFLIGVSYKKRTPRTSLG